MDFVIWFNGVLVFWYFVGCYCDGWFLIDYIGDMIDFDFDILKD